MWSILASSCITRVTRVVDGLFGGGGGGGGGGVCVCVCVLCSIQHNYKWWLFFFSYIQWLVLSNVWWLSMLWLFILPLQTWMDVFLVCSMFNDHVGLDVFFLVCSMFNDHVGLDVFCFVQCLMIMLVWMFFFGLFNV
jgi:hypothetical protein